MASMKAGSSSGNSATTCQEYSIRVPKNVKKKFHVMRFNGVLNVDFSKWGGVKMERENNMKEYKMKEEEEPKFGAGSEYGKEAREEARRKKYGIITKKYRAQDQPWIMKVGGKTGKKFKGIREGGVAENAAYYVFTHAPDGGIDAYPLCEWYNFQPIQRYKALSAEEAEQEFGRRNKVMNYFSLMLRKRLRQEDDIDGEDVGGEESKGKKGGKRKSDFKISEMDDWVDSDDELSGSEGDEDAPKKEAKKKKGKVQAKPKKKRGSDDSAVEESDDGDEEGRELDYISDSSESESDKEGQASKEMKGVAEESALRKLLASDEEDEEDDEDKAKENEEKEAEEEPGSSSKDKEEKDSKADKEKDKKRKRPKGKGEVKPAPESGSGSSGDSSDSDSGAKTKTPVGGNSRSSTPPTGIKIEDSNSSGPPSKKPKLEVPSAPLSIGNDSGITEEAVRRYLMRKPMTTTELLQKFKNRKTGLTSDQLVNVMTQILKRINPVKQTIKNKMYLSIK